MSKKVDYNKQWAREDVINMIISMKLEKMATTKTILDFLQNELGYKQTYSYILLRESREKIIEIYDKNNAGKIEEAIGQLERMLEKSWSKNDFKLSHSIRQELNKLIGLYAAQKVEHSGQVGITGLDIQIIGATNSNE